MCLLYKLVYNYALTIHSVKASKTNAIIIVPNTSYGLSKLTPKKHPLIAHAFFPFRMEHLGPKAIADLSTP